MASDGYGGGEEQYMYHVPQQSRREKLRYQQEEPPFQLLDSHHSNPAPQFYHTSIASSSSHQNPNTYSYCTAAAPAASLFAHHISTQPFSLTLSSSSSSHAPPPRQQLMEAAGFEQRINPAPLGPFTGYSEILSRSRFLEPARQLLEEISGVGGDQTAGQRMSADRAAEEMEAGGGSRMAVGPVGVEEQQQQWRKTRLISMLDELYRRYKLYYQQVQAVVTSFESVPGLSSAAPYATMALKLMSKHFRCLKNAISDQLHNMNKSSGKERLGEEENCGFGIINGGGASPHRPANNYGAIRQPQVWRPQRGLPERAVAVLRAWLFEHFLHPYPTDTDKQILAKQTGLTRNQVSNWFINARVRLWKPMVEEIHSLEMQQKNKSGAGDPMHPNTHNQAQLPSSSTATSSNDPLNHIAHHNSNQNQSSKQPHQELPQISNHHVQAHNYNQLVYDGFSGHRHTGVGLGGGGGGLDHVKGNGGVSLTLGLHQNNNGLSIMEPIPLNVVRRFGLGLEDCNDAYVIGSFEGQDRHFEKDIGGHFLHDFVG